VSSVRASRTPRLSAVRREGERVTSLELFFDLVFVLGLTQCTALIYSHQTWEGVLKGLLVLSVLWWCWGGYAWLTSAVDPEEGSTRLLMLASMAALLVVALCVPQVFGAEALLFACAYGAVRAAHIGLFGLASRDDPALRRSVSGLAVSTAIGVGLLVAAALAGSGPRLLLWCAAVALDMLGPYLFGAEGWRLVPGHFAERHGAIIIIALGESIVAIGAGADHGVSAGVVTAAVLGVAIAGALWWLYFDFVAIVAERRLVKAQEGRERNEIARDSYSYLHLPMVAGIALVAVGMKKTLGAVSAPLGDVAAASMLGGAAMYLLAHVAFRWRNIHRLSTQRVVAAGAVLGLLVLDIALRPASLAAVAALAAVLVVLIVWETRHFAELRERLRHQAPGA
jgi:low temperature requirement protein LtrA